MPNAKDKLKLTLIQPSFSGNSERGRRAEARSNQRMEDTGNLGSPSPSTGNSDENTAKNTTDAGMNISALDKR